MENKMQRLDDLIEQYAINKSELASYEKLCKEENAQIKDIMVEASLSDYTAKNWKISYVVQKRETMNEARLLEIAHLYGIPEIVKTKEYIDFDALENAIYNNLIPQDVILEMDKAKEIKEVVTLRLAKVKKEARD